MQTIKIKTLFSIIILVQISYAVIDCITKKNGDDPYIMYLPKKINCFQQDENYHFELLNISLIGKNFSYYPVGQKLALVSSQHIIYLEDKDILERSTIKFKRFFYGKNIYNNGHAFNLLGGEFWSYKHLPIFAFPDISYSKGIEEEEKGALLQTYLFFNQVTNVKDKITINNDTKNLFKSLSTTSSYYETLENALRVLINLFGQRTFISTCKEHNDLIDRLENIHKDVDKIKAFLENDNIFIEKENDYFFVSPCRNIIPDKVFTNHVYNDNCYENLPVIVNKHLYFVDYNNKLTAVGGSSKQCKNVSILSSKEFNENLTFNRNYHPQWIKSILNFIEEMEYGSHFLMSLLFIGLIGYILSIVLPISCLFQLCICKKIRKFIKKNKYKNNLQMFLSDNEIKKVEYNKNNNTKV